MISPHRIILVVILCTFTGAIQQVHHLGKGESRRRKQQKMT